MADFDINNLDFNNIGSWPIPAKAVLIGILCSGAAFAGYWYDTKEQKAALDALVNKEIQLRQEFEDKQKQANQLPKLKQQLAEIKANFGTLLRRLPSKTEVEGVLVDISQTGLASGLVFELFKPGNKRQSEFYAELPITLRMSGDYHSLGKFVSDVAGLERIVTQHDIKITPGTGKNANTLIMDSTAKTYHYIETEEGGK